MSSSSFHESSLQAKVIVLGDPKTGKSSLIHNLDPQTKAGLIGDDGFGSDDIIFSVVEFPISELLDSSNDLQSNSEMRFGSKSRLPSQRTAGTSVFMKIWEFSAGVSKEEEELAFRGALFCVVVLDLRNPESAKNAFSKWIEMKEKHMNESFLFVVGTHLDKTSQRRVDITEVCKACAQKEAIYTEISNFNGTNISLLRRLMAQRINYVLSIRESVAFSSGGDNEKKGEATRGLGTSLGLLDADYDEHSEEAKIQEHERVLQSLEGPLPTPFLEQDIVCDSIGAILASALGTEYWPGFEAEEEHLSQIGERLTGFLDKLTTEPKTLPKAPIDNSLMRSGDEESIWAMGGGVEGLGLYSIPDPDIEELKHVFEIMGFALPQSLSANITDTPSVSRPPVTPMRAPNAADSSTATPSLTGTKAKTTSSGKHATQQPKLRVRLPDGSMGVLIIYPTYDVVEQVDAFLVQYGMEEDSQARGKLIEAAQSAAKAASLKDIGHSFTNGFGATEHSTPGVGSPTSTTPAPVLPPNTEASFISHHAASTPSASRRKSSLVLHNSSLPNLLNNPPPSNPQFPSTGHSHADAHADRFTDNHQTVSTAAASKSGPSSGTLPPPPATTGHHSVPVASTHVSASAPTLSTTKAPLRTPLMAPPPATAQGAPASPLSPMPKKKSSSDTPSSSQPKLTKRCKVRIQLPDFAGGAIETVVREGEDLMEAAKVIAKEHNLSLGYQQKVYDQLRAAFKK